MKYVTSMPPGGGTPGTGPGAGQTKKKAISAKMIGVVLLTAIALWFILANTERARIRLWLVVVSSPMWLVLAITFVVGGMCGMLYAGRRGEKKQQQR